MPDYDLFPTHRQKTTITADRYRRQPDGRVLLFEGDDELVAEFPADTGIAVNGSVVA